MLPTELTAHIVQFCDFGDKISLRTTCTDLHWFVSTTVTEIPYSLKSNIMLKGARSFPNLTRLSITGDVNSACLRFENCVFLASRSINLTCRCRFGFQICIELGETTLRGHIQCEASLGRLFFLVNRVHQPTIFIDSVSISLHEQWNGLRVSTHNAKESRAARSTQRDLSCQPGTCGESRDVNDSRLSQLSCELPAHRSLHFASASLHRLCSLRTALLPEVYYNISQLGIVNFNALGLEE
jgi:hypothetical protein